MTTHLLQHDDDSRALCSRCLLRRLFLLLLGSAFPLVYLLPLLPSPIAAAAQNSDYDSAAGFTGDSCQLLSVSVSVQVPVASLSLSVSLSLSPSVCQSVSLSVCLSVCSVVHE